MTNPATPLGGTAPVRSLQPHVGQGHIFSNTPTGILTVDRAGGCNGRHASASAVVNAGRIMGGHIAPANFVPGAPNFECRSPGCDESMMITSFHDCEVVDA